MDLETVQKLTDIQRGLDEQELPEKSLDLITPFLQAPAARGVWSMSNVAYTTTPRVYDLTGQGNDLNAVAGAGSVRFFYLNRIVPAVRFLVANTQRLTRADGGAANWADITGTEAYILTNGGLSISCWVRFIDAAGNAETIISKWNTTGDQRSYRLRRTGAGGIEFRISTNGLASTILASTGITTVAGQWYYICGRFNPSTELTLRVNDETFSNLAAIPASIFDSTADFYISSETAATIAFLNGYVSIAGLYACDFGSAVESMQYQQTRAMHLV